MVDNTDNCPTVSNPDQTDSDGNGLGDACDEPQGETVNTFNLEAECAVVGSAWKTETNSKASGSKYVVYRGTSSNNIAPADLPENYVRFTVANAEGGTYHLFARVFAQNQVEDSYWVRVNEGNWVRWNGWEGYGNYTWNKVANAPFSLTAGTNTIDFAYREPGARLDKLHLNMSGEVPTGFGEDASNCGEVPVNQPPIARGQPSVTKWLRAAHGGPRRKCF